MYRTIVMEGFVFSFLFLTVRLFLFFLSFLLSCQRLISVQSLSDNGSLVSVCISAQHYHCCYTLGLDRNDNVGETGTVWIDVFLNSNIEAVCFWHVLSKISVVLVPILLTLGDGYYDYRWKKSVFWQYLKEIVNVSNEPYTYVSLFRVPIWGMQPKCNLNAQKSICMFFH